MPSPLTTQEVLELNKYKTPEVPNNRQDDIQAAMQAARDRREAARRANAKTAEQTSGFAENVAKGVAAFNERLGIKPGITGEVTQEEKVTNQIAESAINNNVEAIEQIDEESGNTPITRTINGKKITKTLNEWLGQAEKVENADEYLSQAVSHLQKTRQPVIQPAVITPPVDNDAEDDALAEAIQVGTPEQRREAVRKLRQQAAESVNQQMTVNAAKERARLAYETVRAANKDIFADPNLEAVAIRKDRELAESGTVLDPNDRARDFELRFQMAVDQTREWYTGVKKNTEAEIKKEDLISRKKKLLNVQSSNAKVNASNEENGQPVFATPEEYNAYVIREMNKPKAQGHRRKVMVGA